MALNAFLPARVRAFFGNYVCYIIGLSNYFEVNSNSSYLSALNSYPQMLRTLIRRSLVYILRSMRAQTRVVSARADVPRLHRGGHGQAGEQANDEQNSNKKRQTDSVERFTRSFFSSFIFSSRRIPLHVDYLASLPKLIHPFITLIIVSLT